MLYTFCRRIFALVVAYPVVYLWLGLHTRYKERLPKSGPAIIIANHNSHLDTLALISCFSLEMLPLIRIAAAADYFFTNPVNRFIAKWFLGLVAVERTSNARRDPLKGMADCLDSGGILVLFPEGTRGQAEKLGEFKPGLWHLFRRCPKATVHPVYFHGLGRSLPKGEWIPVPFFIDACVGEPIAFKTNKIEFMEEVREVFHALRAQTLAGLELEREEEYILPTQKGDTL